MTITLPRNIPKEKKHLSIGGKKTKINDPRELMKDTNYAEGANGINYVKQ